MPAAVANIEEVEEKDLKSLVGGKVTLRRMTYGQVVQRRTMSKLSFTAGRGRGNVAGEMAMGAKEITLFEFAHCIVNHNLEDTDGRKLNLANEQDFNKLDPRVGQELEALISDMNNFEEEEGNSTPA